MPELSSLNALIVDDDPIVIALATVVLEGLGVGNVNSCEDSSEGLRRLREDPASTDLLLLDLMMPELDGIRFLRELSQIDFPGYVILMSGSDKQILGALERLSARKLKLLGVVEKPVTREKVAPLLQKMASHVVESPRTPGRIITDEDIAAGLLASEFIPYFQPKIDLNSNRVIGYEVLARWNMSGTGLISPGEFIPSAENSGQIFDLDMMVLDKACQQHKIMTSNGHRLACSVNMSAISLGIPHASEQIQGIARERGVDLSELVVELTESVLVDEESTAMENILHLHLYGAQLSMDDFGTGYSNMQYLRKIPFSELKIDASFVSGALNDGSKSAIIESSVKLAEKLGMKTVCEGVESYEDHSVSKSLGALIGQGYYYARPMPAEDFFNWIRNYQH